MLAILIVVSQGQLNTFFGCKDLERCIPFDFTNDYYCDCGDCSDEWKTPVNPNGQFVCENKGFISKEIPKMKVRDGVCDCCDGSDEIQGTCKQFCDVEKKLLIESKIKEVELIKTGIMKQNTGILGNLQQGSCKAIYKETEIQKYKKLQSLAELGIQSKSLVDQLQLYSFHDKKQDELNIYGQKNVFKSLIDECITFNAPKYEYEVCFFDKVTQIENGRNRIVLGKWGYFSQNYQQMIFDRGQHCGHIHRSFKLDLICGLNAEILQVQEPEMCVYEAILATPLSCKI